MDARDTEHLRLLSIFHYVLAAVAAFFSSFFLIHVALGASIISGHGPFNTAKNPPPDGFGWLFVGMGSAAILAGWTFAALLVVAGRSLARRRRYLFCLVIAGLACVMCNPLGTVLGVFTIIVLMRPAVKAAFGAG